MSGSLVRTGTYTPLQVIANTPNSVGFSNYFDTTAAKLYWDYNGQHIMSLDMLGNLIVLGSEKVGTP